MKPIPPDAVAAGDQQKILSFLKSHPIGVLATVMENGDPHASTVYFSVNNDLSFSFTTKRVTQKYKNISAHPQIMLAAYDAESQTAVQLSGKAVEITDEAEMQKAYEKILHVTEATGEDVVPPVAKISGTYISYKVEPESIRFSEYGWGNNFKNVMDKSKESFPSGDPA